MADKNIFREIIEEMEKILGGSFRIKTDLAEKFNFCFEDLSKKEIVKSFMETIGCCSKIMAASGEKKFFFIFKEEEIKNLPSLSSNFLRLYYSCKKSLTAISDCYKHPLTCLGCQTELIAMVQYFVFDLNLEKIISANPMETAKYKIFRKYLPLFLAKNITSEEMVMSLIGTAEKKGSILSPEEFEKILRELIQ